MISNVRSVQQDPSGRVLVAFDETRRRTLTGALEDERIQRLLRAAMRQDASPGVRVETMAVLKNSAVPSEIRDVLLYTLQNDPNAGVRLKAVESLQGYASEPDVREALARVLVKDDNPGVRIQAIDLLVQHKDGSMVGVLQELVGREDNQYIRMRMARALEDMNASVGTF
jgi:HEAT repeat protein